MTQSFEELRKKRMLEYKISAERYAMFGVIPLKSEQETVHVNPCPFCGGKAELCHDEGCGGFVDRMPSYYVKCFKCGVTTKNFFCDRDTHQQAREDAVRAWTTRDGKEKK